MSWRFLRVRDKKDHLFPTARAAWVVSAFCVRCSRFEKTYTSCHWRWHVMLLIGGGGGGTSGCIIKNTCASSYSSRGARRVWTTLPKLKVKVHLICWQINVSQKVGFQNALMQIIYFRRQSCHKWGNKLQRQPPSGTTHSDAMVDVPFTEDDTARWVKPQWLPPSNFQKYKATTYSLGGEGVVVLGEAYLGILIPF